MRKYLVALFRINTAGICNFPQQYNVRPVAALFGRQFSRLRLDFQCLSLVIAFFLIIRQINGKFNYIIA